MLDPVARDNMRWHDEEAAFYDAYSKVYTLREQRYLRKAIHTLSRRLAPGSLVLDMGSGTGNVVRVMHEVGLAAMAVDISREMLKSNPAEHRIVAESQSLPFRDGSFAVIVACSVLHHLPNPTQALREACRVAAAPSVVLIPHEPLAGRKLTLLRRTTAMVSWMMWRLTHPATIKLLAHYLVLHRRRLRRVRVGLGSLEKVFDDEAIRELSGALEEHGFTVEAMRAGNVFRLRGQREG